MQVTTGLLPNSSNYKTANRTQDNIKYIVIHYTGNNGDTAIGNVNYFKNNVTKTSAHFFVDESSIYTSVPVKYIAWHCGTSGTYYHNECRNSNSIGIEMCSIIVNGKYTFKSETVNNTRNLTKYLMNQYDIPISNVVRHYDVTHKNCPEPYVKNESAWSDFKNRVSGLSSPDIGGLSSVGNGTSNNVPLPDILKTKDLTYVTATGDTLQGIAQDFYNDSSLYMTIYNANTDKISNANSTLSGGIKLVIPYLDSNKFEDIYTQRYNERVTKNQREFEEQQTYLSKLLHGELNMKNTYSAAFDDRITEILPEEIVSFSMVDSEKDTYNMFEIQIDMPLGLSSGLPPQCYQRVVPDFDSILRFGLRSHPTISTNLISSVGEAEIFGTMMICKSLSKRYSGTLTMIEDSAIKIGNPIRFHIYDEHPFKNTGLFNDLQYPAQAIFYVTGISRNITPNGVSFMTLTLEAGRVMGKESIYDQCLPLYSEYYDEYEYSRLELAVLKNQYETDKENAKYNALNNYDNKYESNIEHANYTKDQKYELVFSSNNGQEYTSETMAKKDMVNITVNVWKMDGNVKRSSTMSITINKNIAGDVKAIFDKIYNGIEKFPIKSIHGYTWRNTTSKSTRSHHSYGTAIDINPNENYYKSSSQTVGSFWKPGENIYSIPQNGEVVKAFKSYGWTWGGDWNSIKDYMHFSYLGG